MWAVTATALLLKNLASADVRIDWILSIILSPHWPNSPEVTCSKPSCSETVAIMTAMLSQISLFCDSRSETFDKKSNFGKYARNGLLQSFWLVDFEVGEYLLED